MENNTKMILIVDDNRDMQYLLSRILKNEGYKTAVAKNGNDVLNIINSNNIDLVLLDIRLPETDGIQVLKKIKEKDKNICVIMLTAYGDVKAAVTAMKLGAYDYITKPFDNEELIIIIKKAIQSNCLDKEVNELREKLKQKTFSKKVIGESPQINHILSQVKIVAPTNMTVIIEGESGTGKELVANMIHLESNRRDKQFVAVDCGAIPETLAESGLFGYEKGAFTGADIRREGEFEQANKGTLFLDEISNFSDVVQVKLLRVLQERKLRHLGGNTDIEVDIRIIVATNVSLYNYVKQGKFRNDLFHRLNEFQIVLPPLRDRIDDIPLLAQYFLNDANTELGKHIKGFTSDSMKFLVNHNWPGNVRELKNTIKRGVLITNSDYILPESLIMNVQNDMELDEYLDKENSYRDIKNKIEREVIKKAIKQSNGNKTKASELLKMDRKSLYRRMKKLDLL